MREINAQDITAQVKRLCMEANSYLPEDIKEKITASEQAEPWALAKNILGIISLRIHRDGPGRSCQRQPGRSNPRGR